MIPLVLTFVGDDRPGLVSAISETIAAHGGTWLESRSARLAGKFAGVLRADVPDANVRALELDLRGLAHAGLHLSVHRGAPDEAAASARRIALEIVGNERPGIVRDVTQTLSRLGVNIEAFDSGLESAPFTGAPMFRAHARLSAPANVAPEDLRRALERLAGEIMVDLTVAEEDRR